MRAGEVLLVQQKALAMVTAFAAGMPEEACAMANNTDGPGEDLEKLLVAAFGDFSTTYHEHGIEALQQAALRLARRQVGLS